MYYYVDIILFKTNISIFERDAIFILNKKSGLHSSFSDLSFKVIGFFEQLILYQFAI